jgi:DNA-binding FadR family transcriptional regulator
VARRGAGPGDASGFLVGVLRPIRPSTPVEETVDRLGMAIRLGLLAGGTRLPPERQLAEQLGISRGALSRALATLVESGYVESRRGRLGGTYVCAEPPISDVTLSPEQQRHVLAWRGGLEIGCIALAAESRDESDIQRMNDAIAAMDLSLGGPYVEYRRADVRFHVALAQAAWIAAFARRWTGVRSVFGTSEGPKLSVNWNHC